MAKFIIANWKMNPSSVKETGLLIDSLNKEIYLNKNIEIVICPPNIFLQKASLLDKKRFNLGVQDISREVKGPFTGEISALMSKSLNASYVILGHSERRGLGESNDIIAQKIKNAIKAKLIPILCVGEKDRTHDGSYLNFIKSELMSSLSLVSKKDAKNIIIAYEPIWSISTTENHQNATGHDFEEIKIYIKKVLSDMYGLNTANTIKILYGGSVDNKNAKEFIDSGADGLLVGKSSLDIKKFSAIINILK